MHKRKPKSFPVTPLVPSVEMSPAEVIFFDYEVCWCIEELDKLISKNPTVKQKREYEGAIKILRDPKVPVIKKRQTMRQCLGDYKKRIEDNSTKGKEVEVKFRTQEKNVVAELARTRSAVGSSISVAAEHSGAEGANIPRNSFRFNFPQTASTPSKTEESEAVDNSTSVMRTFVSIPLSDNSFRFNFSGS